MESLGKRIARAVLIALSENQSIPLQDVPSLPRAPPTNFPPPPREGRVATPLISREVESSATCSPRTYAHGKVDILNDYKKYPIKPSFEGRNCKSEEVMYFILIGGFLSVEVQRCR